MYYSALSLSSLVDPSIIISRSDVTEDEINKDIADLFNKKNVGSSMPLAHTYTGLRSSFQTFEFIVNSHVLLSTALLTLSESVSFTFIYRLSV